ncbi:hypothetical protein SI65_00476 [Aspergillus cristatus]|uniref:Alpha methylacyl-CoA racemase n=1 Tax=Aspergillus cristatus TaxID=573508 RepID=A0A1E3BPS8_ASPCR|nr:hypothetical protein SI65_00476 [Aspergillus cristatus]
MATHTVIPGDDIYGPGSYIDKEPIPVPQDARRVFEYLAKTTPGFTQDQRHWDNVTFNGRPEPSIPGPIKAPVVAAALHAMCGVVANEIVEDRDSQKQSSEQAKVSVNTDHAAIWMGSIFTPYINGTDVQDLFKAKKLDALFEKDLEHGWMGSFMNLRTTAIYKTATPGVWYQLHGSLDAPPVLRSMGMDPEYPAKTPREAYEYIASHVEKWTADELEMHNVRNGFCGEICYTPDGWRKTEMGKRLAEHPLINYKRQSHAIPTPPTPFPSRIGSSDRRPLAGVKVVELVRIIAGPVIGNTLAAFGADVIRVGCDKLRDLNVLQLSLNTGKRTIDLDLNNPKDKQRLHDLLQDADVFVQGFRPKTIARKGFGLNDLLSLAGTRGKGIVYVEENAFGPDGIFHERPGWQQIGDAASGSSYVTGRSLGYTDGTSVLPPLPISDMTTGLLGALGTMLALRDRARTGGSYHVLSSLVAADEIALRPEIGLYSPEVVAKNVETFKWGTMEPSQYVTEVLNLVMDGWKRVFPEHLTPGTEASFMVGFEESVWGKMEMLKPVVKIGDEAVSPRWETPTVPNCGQDKGITWL